MVGNTKSRDVHLMAWHKKVRQGVVCVSACVGVRGQLPGVDSLLPPRGSLRIKQSCETWQQAPYPLSHLASPLNVFLGYINNNLKLPIRLHLSHFSIALKGGDQVTKHMGLWDPGKF